MVAISTCVVSPWGRCAHFLLGPQKRCQEKFQRDLKAKSVGDETCFLSNFPFFVCYTCLTLVFFPHFRWFEGFNWEGLRKGTLTPPIIPSVSFPIIIFSSMGNSCDAVSSGQWYIGLSGNNVLYFFWRCLKKSLQPHSQLSFLSRQALPYKGSVRRAQPWRTPL